MGDLGGRCAGSPRRYSVCASLVCQSLGGCGQVHGRASIRLKLGMGGPAILAVECQASGPLWMIRRRNDLYFACRRQAKKKKKKDLLARKITLKIIQI